LAALLSRSRAFRLSAFPRLAGLSTFFGGGIVSFCGKHMLFDVLKKTQRHVPKHIEGAPGVPRRAKRSRGSALGHPGQGHVEMRGVPGPSGCGTRDRDPVR
jgi:hypothetical protein